MKFLYLNLFLFKISFFNRIFYQMIHQLKNNFIIKQEYQKFSILIHLFSNFIIKMIFFQMNSAQFIIIY